MREKTVLILISFSGSWWWWWNGSSKKQKQTAILWHQKCLFVCLFNFDGYFFSLNGMRIKRWRNDDNSFTVFVFWFNLPVIMAMFFFWYCFLWHPSTRCFIPFEYKYTRAFKQNKNNRKKLLMIKPRWSLFLFCSSDENDTRILNKIRMMCEIFFEFGLVFGIWFACHFFYLSNKTNKKIMMNDGFFLIIHVMLILRSFGSSWINEWWVVNHHSSSLILFCNEFRGKNKIFDDSIGLEFLG